MSKEVSHYVVTAHSPGAVFFSTTCNFCSTDATNVVIAKSRAIEIRNYAQNGDDEPVFQIAFQAPVNGRITSLVSFSTPHSPTAFVFFTTDTLKYAVISYDKRASPYPFKTHASGTLHIYNSKPAEAGSLVCVDPTNTCIALHLVDGFVHIIPIRTGYRPNPQNYKTSHDDINKKTRADSSSSSILGEPFLCRLEEARILSMAFVPSSSDIATRHASSLPLLAVLHQDKRGVQHLISHAVNLAQQQLSLFDSKKSQVNWITKSDVDGGSALLIPIPPPPSPRYVSASATARSNTGGGNAEENAMQETTQYRSSSGGAVLILGQRQWTYVSASSTKIIPVSQALYVTYEILPPDPQNKSARYLISDEFGNLHMLTLILPELRPVESEGTDPSEKPGFNGIVRLQVDTLGSCSIASTITYLDNGVVFVGSVLGDSQLIQISDEPFEDADGLETTYLSVIEEFENLGPILDFDLMEKGVGMATRQVVTASGSSQSGSLRLIRNGIGMNESAVVEIEGIQAMWSVKYSNSDNHHSYLVQAFVGETRVLGVVGNGLEEVVLNGLDASCTSLYVGNVADTKIKSKSSRLVVQITPTELRLIDLENGAVMDSRPGEIIVAAGNTAQVALAMRGGTIYVFDADSINCKLVLHGEVPMDREVSCLDLNPFRNDCSVDDASMQSEYDDSVNRGRYLAVGLWDDCTVRLLSLSTLREAACFNLEVDVGEESSQVYSQMRSHSNGMARSLSMVTLDFNNTTTSFANSTTNPSSTSRITGVNMLFVGLGDGTLISFAIVLETDGNVMVQSKKVVCLGTQRIGLVPLYNERGGTCILATGDRPTVIYLAGVGSYSANRTNPKLCYSNVNVSSSDEDDGNYNDGLSAHHHSIAVNVAAPFFSNILSHPMGSQHYSLCVADDTHLRLGVIDDIQKLHVTTYKLGMGPRRIVHCDSGRLFAVGCVESGSNHAELNSGESTMMSCIRFLDDTTFDDIERIDLDPFEMLLSMAYVTLKLPVPRNSSSDEMRSSDPDVQVFKPLLLVGTAYAFPDEDEPSRGRILVFSFRNDDKDRTASRTIELVTAMSCNGGVYSMCQFYDGKALCSVNTNTIICHLVEEACTKKLEWFGTGHHGHILSLCVKCRAEREATGTAVSGVMVGGQQQQQHEKQRSRGSDESHEMLFIVGDLMRSVSLVQYFPEHETLEEVARDFTANWVTSCEMLSDNVYLAAENFNNLFCLRRNHATSEQVRCRLDKIGEFHFGEQVNKLMRGSLIMPLSPSNHAQTINTSQHSHHHVKSPTKTSSVSPNSTRTRKAVVVTGSQVLFGTVEGTLGVVIGLDRRTAAFFSTLQHAMAKVISSVGNLSYESYRAVQGLNRSYPAHGFVDGDLVETFLDLDRIIMVDVVKEMNRDGGWEVDDSNLQEPSKKGPSSALNEDQAKSIEQPELSLEDVMAMVEEMTMLH